MSVPRGWGKRGLGGIRMEGVFVEMERGGILTHEKRQSVCVLSILKLACAFVQANLSFLFTFYYPVKKKKTDKIVQCESTRPSRHLVPK